MGAHRFTKPVVRAVRGVARTKHIGDYLDQRRRYLERAMTTAKLMLCLTLLAGTLVVSTLTAPVFAQAGPGGSIDPNRDCQTIRRCNFTRTGSFRGCISSYSCRSCELVAARCTINGTGRVCRQMRCNWGA
jgi:hypothetical protein